MLVKVLGVGSILHVHHHLLLVVASLAVVVEVLEHLLGLLWAESWYCGGSLLAGVLVRHWHDGLAWVHHVLGIG